MTYSLVQVFLRKAGVDPLLAFLATVLAMLLGSSHWRARPHIWTFVGAILVVWLLERSSRRQIWLFAPLFAIWANLHGGFIYGLGLICAYLVGELIEALRGEDRAQRLSRAGYYGQALVVSTLACFVNPVGPVALFAHTIGYLGKRLLVDRTQEYMSPDFHEVPGQLFLGCLVLAVVLLGLARRRPTYPRLILLVMNLAFALYSARNIPLFAVTALPILAIGFDPQWRSLAALRHFRSTIADGERYALPGLWASLVTVALLVLALNRGFVGSTPLIPSQFEATSFPVAAVTQARLAGLEGRIYNEFAWGGYILYAWPEQRVYIDGQTDFYGEELLRRYLRVGELQSGWREALREWGISLVIVPSDSVLARELAREPDWHTWYADQTAVILQRAAER